METTENSPGLNDRTGKRAPAGEISGLLTPIRKGIVFVLGISVVIVGIAMIVLPGPATVVIPSGLAILATEFVWARRWLKYLKRRAQEVADWGMGTGSNSQSTPDDVPTKVD